MVMWPIFYCCPPHRALFVCIGSPDVEMMVRTVHRQSCICLVMGWIRICGVVPWAPVVLWLFKSINEGFYSIKMSKGIICIGHLLLCAVYVEVTAAAQLQFPLLHSLCYGTSIRKAWCIDSSHQLRFWYLKRWD